MGKPSANIDTRIAKTAAATTFDDEAVKLAGDNTRRRLAAANSRDKTNAFWTALLASPQNPQNKRNTLG